MADRFSKDEVLLDSVAVSGFSITPNNDVALIQTTRAIYIGTSGNVNVEMIGFEDANVDILFENVPVGILPIRVSRIYSSNTTATGLIGLY